MKNDIDARTVYSLSMTVILYELYKSDFLNSQESLIPLYKSIIFGLLLGQVVFLFVKGFSFAGFGDSFQKHFSKLSDSIYIVTFHLSIIFLTLGSILFGISKIFDFFHIPIYFWTKMTFIVINLVLVVMIAYEWHKSFLNKNLYVIVGFYSSIILWSLFVTLNILSFK